MSYYPHTITVYNRLGEKDRAEQWQHTVLHGVRWQTRKGAARAVSGDSSLDTTVFFIPNKFEGYVSPGSITKESPLKPEEWTLRGQDVIVMGECNSDSPEGDKHVINYSDECSLMGKLHHFEVGTT